MRKTYIKPDIIMYELGKSYLADLFISRPRITDENNISLCISFDEIPENMSEDDIDKILLEGAD